jgi:hypothetical protein
VGGGLVIADFLIRYVAAKIAPLPILVINA